MSERLMLYTEQMVGILRAGRLIGATNADFKELSSAVFARILPVLHGRGKVYPHKAGVVVPDFPRVNPYKDSPLEIDAGQWNELKLSARKAGAVPEDWERLSRVTMLGRILLVLRGQAEVKETEHIVDLDAVLYIPLWSAGLRKIEEHKVGGQFKFDPGKIKLYLSGKQREEEIIGSELYLDLKKKPIFNANLLDYLLIHPELIPEEWKGETICFWGTQYWDNLNNIVVRALVWRENFHRWEETSCRVGGKFDHHHPAVMLDEMAEAA